MLSSGILIESSPLTSPPRRIFARESLLDLSDSDRESFENFGQGPLVPLPYTCIHHAIADVIRRYPGYIAVQHQETQITYEELDRQSDHLAELLAQNGVGRGDKVALFIQRSIPMVIGILATLKLGAAYVPQDARMTPRLQLEHVLRTSGAKVVLTLEHLLANIPDVKGVEVISIDETPPIASADARLRSEELTNETDLCFVLFTSGTTGKPNGVQVTHRNVCNILLTSPGHLGMRPGRKVSQILNIAFDMAAWEVLGALSHGSTLVIRGSDIQETVQKVDIVIATPSILGRLDPQLCQNVSTVAVAGEPCPKPLADAWSKFAEFYNSCGPTEVTIVNTMQNYTLDSRQLTIGKPTPNNTVYILDENLKPLPIGEIGEMWAGGDCVSDGYVGNETLTADRYKPDPFLGGSRRMFRTRDLGRWTQAGYIEHFGRTDDQVKIRGFRVELDSVSAAIESVEGCLQAVTLKFDSENLVSFVRPKNVDLDRVQSAIAVRLPYYCMPKRIFTVDNFPRTDRGKIDKRALTVEAVSQIEQQGANL